MNVKNLLRITGLIFALSGCAEVGPADYLQGRVIKEMGTAPLLRERSIFKGEGTNLGELSYGLKVETEEGIYSFGVYEDNDLRDSEGNLTTPKSLLVLEEQIEEGDVIKFTLGCVYNRGGDKKTYFQEDKNGNVPSNYVSVVKKKEE